MDYEKLPNELINRQIARRLGWQVKMIAPKHFITLDPNGQQVHGSQFRKGDFYRGAAWQAATEKAGSWADDLNAAFTLIPSVRPSLFLLMDENHDRPEMPEEWVAEIRGQGRHAYIGYAAPTPARAICCAWLCWHDEQGEER